jgi:hypothetical protein
VPSYARYTCLNVLSTLDLYACTLAGDAVGSAHPFTFIQQWVRSSLPSWSILARGLGTDIMALPVSNRPLVARLHSHPDGACTHVVCIVQKFIFDPCEPYVLMLNQDSLNTCVRASGHTLATCSKADLFQLVPANALVATTFGVPKYVKGNDPESTPMMP